MEELRIIIAGGRDFNDYKLLRKETLRIIKETVGKINKENVTIVSGDARGADRLGECFAKEFGLKLQRFKPDWDNLGKSAGYTRNIQMAQYVADIGEDDQAARGMLIAFWDGQSKGTKHMIDIAQKMGIETHVVGYNNCLKIHQEKK